jgi:hypothetical protein
LVNQDPNFVSPDPRWLHLVDLVKQNPNTDIMWVFLNISFILKFEKDSDMGALVIQGVLNVLTQFCEALSQEPLGLQKLRRLQCCVSSFTFLWFFKNVKY